MTSALDWGVADLSDAELARAAGAGDRRAFAGIYDRYADRLHDFSVGMLRDRDAAADCVQDVFCKAATELANLREPDKLRPWLYSIARNQALRCINARRREQVFDEVPDAASSDADPATLAQRNELARLIDEAAGGLSDRDRSVLELSYRHGLEGQALADALGVSTNSANVMVFRLRETIERSLGALLVARQARNKPDACRELAAILAGWDGRFTILMRKRIARHIEACPTCDQDRRRLVNPRALLGGAPLFIPAPGWLRGRTLGRIQLTAAEFDLNTAAGLRDGSSDEGRDSAATQAAPTQLDASAKTGYGGGAAASDDQSQAIGAYHVDEVGPNMRVRRRMILLVALFIGIPLTVLGLTIAWAYIPGISLTPSGVTETVPVPTGRQSTGLPTSAPTAGNRTPVQPGQSANNGGAPGQPGQSGQPAAGPTGQPGQSANNGGAPGQPGQSGQPAAGPTGQPGQSANNGGAPGQPGQSGQPAAGPTGQPGQSANNGGAPGQPGQSGQPAAGPTGQPGQPANNGGAPGQPGQSGQPAAGPTGQPGQPANNGGAPGQPGQSGQPAAGPTGQPGQSANNGGAPGQPGQSGQPAAGPTGQPGQSANNGGAPGQPGQSGQPAAGPTGQPGQPAPPSEPKAATVCPDGTTVSAGFACNTTH